MRKSAIVIVVLVAVLLAGCVTAPRWVTDPRVSNDAIYGIDSAKASDVGRSRDLALAGARANIAFSLESLVEGALHEYFQESGADGDMQSLDFVERISRQTTEATLRLLRVDKTEIMRDGTVWVRVRQDLDDFYAVGEEILEEEAEFIREEAAAYAEFKFEEALEAYILDNPDVLENAEAAQ